MKHTLISHKQQSKTTPNNENKTSTNNTQQSKNRTQSSNSEIQSSLERATAQVEIHPMFKSQWEVWKL